MRVYQPVAGPDRSPRGIGRESLILDEGGDSLVCWQIVGKSFDLGEIHVLGVVFVVEQDELFELTWVCSASTKLHNSPPSAEVSC